MLKPGCLPDTFRGLAKRRFPKTGYAPHDSVKICSSLPWRSRNSGPQELLSSLISISYETRRTIYPAGIWLASYWLTYKIGFPGWPDPILDSVTGNGVSITMRGACTSPLFYFQNSCYSSPTARSLETPGRSARGTRFAGCHERAADKQAQDAPQRPLVTVSFSDHA